MWPQKGLGVVKTLIMKPASGFAQHKSTQRVGATVGIVGIVASLIIKALRAGEFHPAVLFIFPPVPLFLQSQRSKEQRQALFAVNTAPRRHHGIYAARSRHQHPPALFQNCCKFLERFQVTIAPCCRYSVSSRHAHVFYRRAIYDQIEMISWQLQLKKISHAKLHMAMRDTKILLLEIHSE